MHTTWKLRAQCWCYTKGGRWFPGLTERVLWQQSFTTHRRDPNPTHSLVLKQARQFTLGVADLPPGVLLPQLTGYHWGDAGRLVLLLHGWNGIAADFYKLILGLLAQGYQVIALDLPAHHASPGSNLPTMVQAIRAYIRTRGVPYAIVAHSLGGLAAAIVLARMKVQVEALVFIGSPVTARYTFEKYFAWLSVPTDVRARFYQHLARRFGTSVESFTFPSAVDLRARRMLAIYDIDDQTITFPEPAEYLRHNPAIACLLVAGIGHYQLVRQPTILNAIQAFLMVGTSSALANLSIPQGLRTSK